MFISYYLWLLFRLIGFKVYKYSRPRRDDWIESHSWYWIGTPNTCTYFLWRCKSYTWVKNSLEKLDNELHVKVNKCVK